MNLTAARKSAGMTIEQLAHAAGISVSSICRYEKGNRTPRVRVAKKIGKILGIPWYEVMDNKKAS